MTVPKPSGRDSATRQALIQATAQVMLEEGYAAATSRRVAARAGVKPALVHYYFPTLDDLFLEVMRRRAEQQLARQDRMLSSDRPLHALWKQSKDADGAGLLTELMALANHRKVVRAELAEYAEQFRLVQLKALEDHINESGLDVPPVTLLVLVAGMARALVLEESLGMMTGIADTYAVIERLLDTIEPPPPTA